MGEEVDADAAADDCRLSTDWEEINDGRFLEKRPAAEHDTMKYA